jgi:hypothetical protein
MLLLDAMIGDLGPLESWPTYILQHLFVDHPSPTRTSRLRKVISFFYGNDMPVIMAYTFYNACCRCTGATARFVKQQTKNCYIEWNYSRCNRHITEYYSMLFKKFYYLNGSQLNQQELVLPEVTTMQFGIDGTTPPLTIRRRL